MIVKTERKNEDFLRYFHQLQKLRVMIVEELARTKQAILFQELLEGKK